MKTKAKKEFDAVQFMRDRRNLISEKLSKMTKAEIVEYFKRKRLENGIKPCAQSRWLRQR
ncbi:MAG: hypothetical protein MI975_06925 [Cytophagales bacterium]|nr:hypothetical protein [Cytophagales bacterium]